MIFDYSFNKSVESVETRIIKGTVKSRKKGGLGI